MLQNRTIILTPFSSPPAGQKKFSPLSLPFPPSFFVPDITTLNFPLFSFPFSRPFPRLRNHLSLDHFFRMTDVSKRKDKKSLLRTPPPPGVGGFETKRQLAAVYFHLMSLFPPPFFGNFASLFFLGQSVSASHKKWVEGKEERAPRTKLGPTYYTFDKNK